MLRGPGEHNEPAIGARVIVGLLTATSCLLDQQLTFLGRAFLKDGGLRERMTRARPAARGSTRA